MMSNRRCRIFHYSPTWRGVSLLRREQRHRSNSKAAVRMPGTAPATHLSLVRKRRCAVCVFQQLRAVIAHIEYKVRGEISATVRTSPGVNGILQTCNHDRHATRGRPERVYLRAERSLIPALAAAVTCGSPCFNNDMSNLTCSSVTTLLSCWSCLLYTSDAADDLLCV